jgi:hypothetical protein
LLIANNFGFVNIFEITSRSAEQAASYKLEPFTEGREQLISASVALKEDFVGFLTSNYANPGQCTSFVHLYKVSADKVTLAPDMVIDMGLFGQTGYDPNLVAINLDFDVNGYPFILAFPRTSPFIYSLDISGERTKTKAINVGHFNTKSLAYFEDYLFGLDKKMQIIEVSKVGAV